MRKLALLAALVMVFSVTGVANAGKEHFAHWGCNETVTWKTNGSKKLVKRQARLINKTVDSFTLVKHKGRGKPDINIKFSTPAKIVRVAGDSDVLGIAYYGLIDNKWLNKVKVLTPKIKLNKTLNKVTFVHEFWHAVGMDHVKRSSRVSLMNPYRSQNSGYKVPTSADMAALKALDDICKPRPDDGETEKPPPIVDYPDPTPTPTSIPTYIPEPTPTYTPEPTPTETSNPPPPTETSDPDPEDLLEDCGDESSENSCSSLV